MSILYVVSVGFGDSELVLFKLFVVIEVSSDLVVYGLYF